MFTVSRREKRMFRLINDLRASLGLPPYRLSLSLCRKARRHSRDMAGAGEIYHADFALPDDWMAWGQNVGMGGTVPVVERAFEQSPHHLPQLVDEDFTLVGVGVVDGKVGDTPFLFITQNFLARD